MADQHSRAIDNLERLSEVEPRELARISDLGEAFAFTEATDVIETLIALYGQVPREQIEHLPESSAKQIADVTDTTLKLFDGIENFDPKQNNAVQVRDQLISQTRNNYTSVFSQIFPLITYLKILQYEQTSQVEKFNESLAAARQQASEFESLLSQQKDEADSLLAAVRSLASEQGVGQQASYFKDTADGHEASARIWLFVTVASLISLVSFSSYSLFFASTPNGQTTVEIVNFVLSKFLLFSVLAATVFYSSKNYFTHRHNEVVNRHRENALKTFTVLTDSAASKASSDIVLNHAAACIYAPQETGLAKQTGSMSEMAPGLQVISKIDPASS